MSPTRVPTPFPPPRRPCPHPFTRWKNLQTTAWHRDPWVLSVGRQPGLPAHHQGTHSVCLPSLNTTAASQSFATAFPLQTTYLTHRPHAAHQRLAITSPPARSWEFDLFPQGPLGRNCRSVAGPPLRCRDHHHYLAAFTTLPDFICPDALQARPLDRRFAPDQPQPCKPSLPAGCTSPPMTSALGALWPPPPTAPQANRLRFGHQLDGVGSTQPLDVCAETEVDTHEQNYFADFSDQTFLRP